MHMSKEADKMKHLKKRDREKKKAERKVNEAIKKEELLKQSHVNIILATGWPLNCKTC